MTYKNIDVHTRHRTNTTRASTTWMRHTLQRSWSCSAATAAESGCSVWYPSHQRFLIRSFVVHCRMLRCAPTLSLTARRNWGRVWAKIVSATECYDAFAFYDVASFFRMTNSYAMVESPMIVLLRSLQMSEKNEQICISGTSSRNSSRYENTRTWLDLYHLICIITYAYP